MTISVTAPPTPNNQPLKRGVNDPTGSPGNTTPIENPNQPNNVFQRVSGSKSSKPLQHIALEMTPSMLASVGLCAASGALQVLSVGFIVLNPGTTALLQGVAIGLGGSALLKQLSHSISVLHWQVNCCNNASSVLRQKTGEQLDDYNTEIRQNVFKQQKKYCDGILHAAFFTGMLIGLVSILPLMKGAMLTAMAIGGSVAGVIYLSKCLWDMYIKTSLEQNKKNNENRLSHSIRIYNETVTEETTTGSSNDNKLKEIEKEELKLITEIAQTEMKMMLADVSFGLLMGACLVGSVIALHKWDLLYYPAFLLASRAGASSPEKILVDQSPILLHQLGEVINKFCGTRAALSRIDPRNNGQQSTEDRA